MRLGSNCEDWSKFGLTEVRQDHVLGKDGLKGLVYSHPHKVDHGSNTEPSKSEWVQRERLVRKEPVEEEWVILIRCSSYFMRVDIFRTTSVFELLHKIPREKCLAHVVNSTHWVPAWSPVCCFCHVEKKSARELPSMYILTHSIAGNWTCRGYWNCAGSSLIPEESGRST